MTDSNDLIKSFNMGSDQHMRGILTDPRYCSGECLSVSCALAKHLNARKIPAEVVQVVGRKHVGKTASPNWKRLDSKGAGPTLWHAMVRVDDQFVDLTGAQYGKEYGGRRILTEAAVRKEWSEIWQFHPDNVSAAYGFISDGSEKQVKVKAHSRKGKRVKSHTRKRTR